MWVLVAMVMMANGTVGVAPLVDDGRVTVFATEQQCIERKPQVAPDLAAFKGVYLTCVEYRP